MISFALDMSINNPFELDKEARIVDICFKSASLVLILIKLAVLTIIVAFYSKNDSELKFLFEGIRNSRIARILYYVHFVLYWIVLAVLIGLGGIIDIKILLLVMTGI